MAPRGRTLILVSSLLCASVVGGAPRGAGAQIAGDIPGFADELPDWLPSLSIGGGIWSRTVNASFDGTTTSSTTVRPLQRTPCVPRTPQPGSLCFYSADASDPFDSFAMPVSAQVMGPPSALIPGRPRLLVHGGYYLAFEDRVLASDGFLPSDFNNIGTEPQLGMQLLAEPQDGWWVGGGVALQLPFESYPTWLKLSLNYMEETTEIGAVINQVVGNTLPPNPTEILGSTSTFQTLTTKSFAPGVGFEAILGKLGPIGIALSGDLLVPIALSGREAHLELFQPGCEPVPCNFPPYPVPTNFDYKADRLGFLGMMMVRFVWLGL